jgi:site-specific recombinase XerD
MTNQTTIIPYADPESIIYLVLDSVSSDHSKRAYKIALKGFLSWYNEQDKPGLTKATVQRYKAVLQASGLSNSSINLKMSAIRKLAQEAGDNGLIEQPIANGISRIKGVKHQGVRTGNWLSKDQAQSLINLPDINTHKGLRDRAILAILIGAGLRRSEVASLTFSHLQQRESRWVIIDLIGKGKRVRSVPIPLWVKDAIDEYAITAGIEQSGNIFRRISRYDNITGDHMTPQAVRDVVVHYSNKLGVPIATHDLRRTYAKLAHKGGSSLDQVQLSLGHSSIQTTQIYLGLTQSIIDSPGDHLGLNIN